MKVARLNEEDASLLSVSSLANSRHAPYKIWVINNPINLGEGNPKGNWVVKLKACMDALKS